MKFSPSEKKVRNGYVLAFLILLLSYFLIYLNTVEMEKKSGLVDRTNESIYNLEVMVSIIKEGEASIRGYALTGDSIPFNQFNLTKARTDSIIKVLQHLHTFDTIQLVRLEIIRAQVAQKMDVLVAAARIIKQPGHTKEDLAKINFPDTKLMNNIKKVVVNMQEHERHKLSERVSEYNKTYASLKITNFVALFLAIMLAVFSLVAFEKENRAKKNYRAELEAGIEKLKLANKELVSLKSIEKFAISGRISRTLAHEIRNPLTSISLATDQLMDTLSTNEDYDFLLQIIKRNSERINGLISQLLNSTKFSELQLSFVSPKVVLDEALELAVDRIRLYGVKIIKNYSTQNFRVEVDKEKLKIALLNIIVNGIEAMDPGKGVLEVKVEQNNDKCLISIKDNGYGMNKEEVSKIFDPYFTTKESGNGLGLTNTQNIILNHNGTIDLESFPGKGTTFLITLNLTVSVNSDSRQEQYF
jgi:signal transduction histidine kinase